jgi:imidazolonepropionase-like amidohydrolase
MKKLSSIISIRLWILFLFQLLLCYSISAYAFASTAALDNKAKAYVDLPEKAAADLLITNVTIVTADPNASDQVSKEHGFVLVQQGMIQSITKQMPAVPKNCQIIDGRSKYLIPGLIDSHIHPYRVPGFHAGHYQKFPQWVEAWRQAEPKLYLWHGFTSLVDAGDWQPEQAAKYYQSASSPTLYGVGATVRQLDGYGHNFYPKPATYQALPNWIFNPSQQLPAGADPSQHQPDNAVQRVVQQQGIALKTFVEDGFSGAIPDLQLPEPALLKQVVTEAHKAHLPVLLHATSATGYQLGINAGVDIFAHGLWHFAPADFWSVQPQAEVTTILGQLTSKHYVQPTLRVVLAEQQALDTVLSFPEVLHQALPPQMLNWYQSEAGRWGQVDQLEFVDALKQRLPFPSAAVEASAEQLATRMSNRARLMLQLMQHKKVQLILGTDTPSPDSSPVAIAGANGIAELLAWSDAGVPLKDIFLAVTARNAHAFKLPVGEIQAGKVADLLLLDSDPLQSVQAYQHIHRWIVRGRLFRGDEIFQSILNKPQSVNTKESK